MTVNNGVLSPEHQRSSSPKLGTPLLSTASTAPLGTSKATCSSSPPASTPPKPIALPSLPQLSLGLPDESHAGSLTVTATCTHPGCQRPFQQVAADILYCPSCRLKILNSEGRSFAYHANREALASARAYEKLRGHWDELIFDENGRLVWKTDLAKRYRSTTCPRPIRTQRYN